LSAINGQPFTFWRVLLPIGLGTGLSLIGDASLYTVLPTNVAAAGIPLASVGILLSANRFIRLVLNGPAGLAYDRWRRRWLFVPALFIGAFSTAIYALTQGFWPLLVGRLLWGLAWAGIWVGGNTIILDVTRAENRGRWVGIYQISFFLGSSSGSFLGGLLTDRLGYHLAMGIGATLTLMGAIIALAFLPETRGLRPTTTELMGNPEPRNRGSRPTTRAELASAMALLGVNRLVLAGVLNSTLGLFLLERMGDPVYVAGRPIGVATLTGMGLGLNALIAMTSAPIAGGLSDRLGSRWPAVAWSLVPGIAGFGLFAVSTSTVVLAGLPLMAIAGGSNQSLSTAMVGDLGDEGRRSRRLGLLFTVGDLTSAIGPLLAYALIPLLGLRGVYLGSAGLFAVMFLIALKWAVRSNPINLTPT
jgi:MFS family permease